MALSLGGSLWGFALSPAPAQAQGFFSVWEQPPKVRKLKKPRPQRPAGREEAASGEARTALRPSKGPVVLNVSLARQRVTVYDGERVVAQAPISSGRVGYATPTGVFTILEKKRMHYSNLYAGASMPNMQRITWSGVALHAGVLPGYPASHGCIRLPYGFSKRLYGMTKLGSRVIVTREPVAPVLFTHERLFEAYPPEDAVATGSIATQAAEASNAAGGMPVVSVAAAAEPAALSPMPRSPYRARLEAELRRIDAAIRTAGYKRAETAIALEQAAKAADRARAPYLKARSQLEKLEMAAGEAEAARDGVQREIEEIDRRRSSKRRLSADQLRKIDARRGALVAKLSTFTADALAARAAWAAEADALKPLETAMMEAEARRRAAFAEHSKASADLAQALEEENSIKRQEAKRSFPVSVFISRKTLRLYVRQGYEPILDVPVAIERSDEPLGTHVFTALDYAPNRTEMTWSVVSIPAHGSARPDTSSRKGIQAKPEKGRYQPAPGQAAAAALERITIPEEVRERIADVMKPGSSLVISDNGMSGETGKYTDFIVSLR